MPPKRSRDEDPVRPAKKQRQGGFSVGPANLPDGIHKRKVQKIKKDLIHKAKLKKQYAKLKAREEEANSTRKSVYDREDEINGKQNESSDPMPEPNLEPHPDRIKMLEQNSPEPDESSHQTDQRRRRRRPRPQPFQKEEVLAQKKKEQATARRIAKDEAEKDRARKVAERERFRRTMAKARIGGPNGQRKLGRESTVLLEKAKRLVGST